MENLIDVLSVGNRYLNATDHYFKLNDTTVINTIPNVHILHSRMSDSIVSDVANYMDTVNNNSADKDLVANISGDQSEMDLNNPLMHKYRDKLLKSAQDYIKIHTNEIYTVGVQASWSVKMNSGDFNPIHKHDVDTPSGLATICYIKVPKNINNSLKDGCLDFTWNRETADRWDMFEQRESTTVLPVVGDYYVFPKWLNHTVYPYRGDEDRWSIQSNLFIFKDDKGENDAKD